MIRWTSPSLCLKNIQMKDVQYIRFTDLHRYVCELDGFIGEPDKSNEAILEAIQMAWLDELD